MINKQKSKTIIYKNKNFIFYFVFFFIVAIFASIFYINVIQVISDTPEQDTKKQFEQINYYSHSLIYNEEISSKKIFEELQKIHPEILSFSILNESLEETSRIGDISFDYHLIKNETNLGNYQIFTNDDNFILTSDGTIKYSFKEIFKMFFDQNDIHSEYWYVFYCEDNLVAMKVQNIVSSSFYSKTRNDTTILAVTFLVFLIVSTTYFIIIQTKNSKIRQLLYYDNKIYCHNFDYFVEFGQKYLNKNLKSKKDNFVYSIINIKIEKFKNYEALNGYEKGKELLEAFNDTAKKYVFKNEILAYNEKSSFLLLLKTETLEQTEARTFSIINDFKNLYFNEKIFLSVGGCLALNLGEDIRELISNASLSRVKNLEYFLNTNNTKIICWYSNEMQDEAQWERMIENDMDKALANGDFKVYIQPKYHPLTQKLGGGEALIRWFHPEEGIISPGRFIPIFEKNGFINKIDDFMLTQVSQMQARWYKAKYPVVPISVNVSRVHFNNPDLAKHIAQIVDENECPRKLIEIELTESAFFDNKKLLLQTVLELKKMGFIISMDDFGSGYSSLNTLKELPLDIIKMDKDFFTNVTDTERSNAIISSTIKLAKKLKMKTVAEGIESKTQVEFLGYQGCDLIQGFVFSEPIPAEDFAKKEYEKNK